LDEATVLLLKHQERRSAVQDFDGADDGENTRHHRQN
jgi:hypothetical protein